MEKVHPSLKLQVFTQSQNGRGWKGPLWVTQPNPLPKQGHLQQAVEDLGQAGLEYLQRRRLHSLPGQPGPGLRAAGKEWGSCEWDLVRMLGQPPLYVLLCSTNTINVVYYEEQPSISLWSTAPKKRRCLALPQHTLEIPRSTARPKPGADPRTLLAGRSSPDLEGTHTSARFTRRIPDVACAGPAARRCHPRAGFRPKSQNSRGWKGPLWVI